MSFDVQSNPPVSGVLAGQFFNVAYTNFSYLLNGAAVSTPVGIITFFSNEELGLFSVCFVAACPNGNDPSIGVEGAHLYSGSESSPTILMGSYLPSAAHFNVEMHTYGLASVSNVNVTAVSAVTPEPSSFALLGTGLLGVLGIACRRLDAGAYLN